MRNWSTRHREWLDSLKFENRALRITFQEYLHSIDEIKSRVERLGQEIHEQAIKSVHAPVIQALQSLRGVAEVAATTLVAEIGQFSRFENPRQLMAYCGLVPSEHSSGTSRRKGGITKTGNAQARHVLIQSAWSYRYKPAVKGALRRRQKGQDPEVLRIPCKAQHRLHDKFYRLLFKGKPKPVAVTAIARELIGFIRAIACKAEEERMELPA